MKTYLIALIFCFSMTAVAQNIDQRVSGFKNSCTEKYSPDMDEPQMRWSLTSEKAEFYVVSKYDKTQREAWQTFNVKEIKEENDPTNGKAYIYSISSYKNGEATLLYVPQEKFIKVTMKESGCIITYDLY